VGEKAGDLTDYGWLAKDAIARQATVRPGQVAVHDLGDGRVLTYGELEQEVRRCDALLRGLAAPRERVAVLARNSWRHVVLFYACARAGVIFVPVNWRLTGPELSILFEDAEPSLVLCEDEFAQAAGPAIEALLTARVFRLALGAQDDFAEALASVAPIAPQTIEASTPSALLYTSGTTGRPKGAVITPKTAFYAGMNFSFAGEVAPGRVQLCDVPMFHVVGLLVVLHATLLSGATLRISPRFAPETTLARLKDPDLAVTHYFCVPQMVQALLEAPGGRSADLTGLRMFNGGAPMPPELTLALLDLGALPSNGYGMTENGTILAVPLDREMARAKAGSAGVAAPAIEIRIVDAEGQDLAEGETGEMWLRGPSITPGYWNQPEATAKAFVDGWFRTGDAARRDADGFYFIIDRYKDMYITGGENVYPAEIEQAIGAMAAVAEAAVVGVPDTRWGECGWAFVVIRPGMSLTCEEVVAWCDGRLARYKRPAHVRFIGALPRTASGKIQKDSLRRLAAQNQTDSQTELQS
jgi:fatty-acyl-CoA synthase